LDKTPSAPLIKPSIGGRRTPSSLPPSRRVEPNSNVVEDTSKASFTQAKSSLQRMETILNSESSFLSQLAGLTSNFEASMKVAFQEMQKSAQDALEKEKEIRIQLEKDVQQAKKELEEAENAHLKDLQEMLTSKNIEDQKARRFAAEVRMLKAKQEKTKLENIKNSIAQLESETEEIENNFQSLETFVGKENNDNLNEDALDKARIGVFYIKKAIFKVQQRMRHLTKSSLELNDPKVDAELKELELRIQKRDESVDQISAKIGGEVELNKQDFWESIAKK